MKKLVESISPGAVSPLGRAESTSPNVPISCRPGDASHPWRARLIVGDLGILPVQQVTKHRPSPSDSLAMIPSNFALCSLNTHGRGIMVPWQLMKTSSI